jgi:hypothetical protein
MLLFNLAGNWKYTTKIPRVVNFKDASHPLWGRLRGLVDPSLRQDGFLFSTKIYECSHQEFLFFRHWRKPLS